ncbi:MAG: DUF4185 domain-containing protein [Candidatus Competibacteraceae bacterium]|nr:DUF4185 domain-containing protein [Candidatus Competibacteraceae bacterium]
MRIPQQQEGYFYPYKLSTFWRYCTCLGQYVMTMADTRQNGIETRRVASPRLAAAQHNAGG